MAKEEFTEAVVLVDPTEKLIQGVITVRETLDGPKYSFALLRDFIRSGVTNRTPWMSKRHIAGMRRVLDMIENWFDAEDSRLRKGR